MNDDDQVKLRSELSTINPVNITDSQERNKYISLKMYLIDVDYTKYEAQLTHENAAIGLGATLASLGLTTAASVIPVGGTTRVLSAAATGVTGATNAYDKDILLAQTIQNVQTQMRASRNEQAARIIASMPCDLVVYPVGRALSDLELYYRAGTLSGGLIGVTASVNQAAADAKAKKDGASPAKDLRESAADYLAGRLAEEAVAAKKMGDACVVSPPERPR